MRHFSRHDGCTIKSQKRRNGVAATISASPMPFEAPVTTAVRLRKVHSLLERELSFGTIP
jgi:hypothetical protein